MIDANISSMKKLSTYVSAIHLKESAVSVSSQTVETSCWQDQGFEVCKNVTTYHFNNGVVIRHTVEQDSFPSELACAECWITYEVLSRDNSDIAVRPQRKVFENACRESFWLAYHTA